MLQFIEVVCNFVCVILCDVSCVVEFFVDSQFQFVCFCVKMVEMVLQNLFQLEGQLDVVKDWSGLVLVQSVYMKL